ncbi:MAG: IS200/IS605 family transposase [Promethearchaeota archaeon]
MELFQTYAERFDVVILAKEIISDHEQLFLSVSPKVAPRQIANYLKGWISRVIRKEFPWLRKYRVFWSPSYFVASRGNVSSEIIKKYIEESQNI